MEVTQKMDFDSYYQKINEQVAMIIRRKRMPKMFLMQSQMIDAIINANHIKRPTDIIMFHKVVSVRDDTIDIPFKALFTDEEISRHFKVIE